MIMRNCLALGEKVTVISGGGRAFLESHSSTITSTLTLGDEKSCIFIDSVMGRLIYSRGHPYEMCKIALELRRRGIIKF
jgi:hypothetical protein